MPVETFTAFVAEQAVGIVVGVTAVVIAPKVLPRLGRAAKKAKQLGITSVEGPLSVAAVAGPPIKSGSQTVYKGTVGGLLWYGTKWEDLFSEAQEIRVAGTAQPASNLVRTLAAARAISDLPGRLRLKMKQIQGNQPSAAVLTEALDGLPRIHKIQFSLASGSVLILYDPDYYPSADALRQEIAAVQAAE